MSYFLNLRAFEFSFNTSFTNFINLWYYTTPKERICHLCETKRTFDDSVLSLSDMIITHTSAPYEQTSWRSSRGTELLKSKPVRHMVIVPFFCMITYPESVSGFRNVWNTKHRQETLFSFERHKRTVSDIRHQLLTVQCTYERSISHILLMQATNIYTLQR